MVSVEVGLFSVTSVTSVVEKNLLSLGPEPNGEAIARPVSILMISDAFFNHGGHRGHGVAHSTNPPSFKTGSNDNKDKKKRLSNRFSSQ